jgi:hypothetical protein
MPDLDFKVVAVKAAAHALTPLLQFELQIAAPESTPIQALLLNAQIQIQPPQRSYSGKEKEMLVELFGAPKQWGQTLRNRLWAHVNATVGAFQGEARATLTVPCSYDLNVATTKYFYALEGGEVPLLFLFSGSAFYLSEEGRLQVERISWEKECAYRMSIAHWRDLMEEHYPNCGWMQLRKDVFERLYEYRRLHGLATWEATVDQLIGDRSEEGRFRVGRAETVETVRKELARTDTPLKQCVNEKGDPESRRDENGVAENGRHESGGLENSTGVGGLDPAAQEVPA